MNPNRTTWASAASAVALSWWALAGLQAETAAAVARCEALGRTPAACALIAYGR